MSPGKTGKRSRTKRSSDNQTESQEMVNSKASPATPSASQARRRIIRKEHEASQDLSGSSQDLSGSSQDLSDSSQDLSDLLESRSQAALSSELTPTRNTTKSKSHTGNVEDPLKHGKQHNFFSYELCLFTDDVKSKSYKKELDRRSEAGTFKRPCESEASRSVQPLFYHISQQVYSNVYPT